MLVKYSMATTMLVLFNCTTMGGARLFLLGGGQGAGHVGADISHGRALDGCMDDNCRGAAVGGEARARALGAAAPCSPLEPPMCTTNHNLTSINKKHKKNT